MLIGQTLSTYRITAALGAGGMGEVYRATDTKLGREVAIKVLPAEMANDAGRLERFQREAHLLASLNHPHIAAIHGLEEADGQPFLVLELVEGEDLRERLSRGPIPVDEALEIAQQIAEALEDAHNTGIIYRDLKPANVKVTPDGKVKVLDFGLAKAWAGDAANRASSSASMSESPTLAHSGTQAGVILGTAAYMSPEQARGKPVDKRTDVWAFAVLLWEMLAGRVLFAGDTVTDVIAAVVKEEPDLDALPSETPSIARRLIARGLRKDPRTRLPDMGGARLDLQDALAGLTPETDTNASANIEIRPLGRQGGAWAVATFVVAAVAATFAFVHLTEVPGPGPTARFVIDAPEGWSFAGRFDGPVPSPDGRQLVFLAENNDPEDGAVSSLLWLRSLDSLRARPLAGTEGAQGQPFWSPDGRLVGFFAQGKLRKLSLSDGVVQTICTTPYFAGADWSAAGTIIFGRGDFASAGLYTVVANGGEPKVVLARDVAGGEFGLVRPQFLPDGRRFIFSAVGGSAPGVYLGSLDSLDERRLLIGEIGTLQQATGHVLFSRGSTLFAQPFDTERAELDGEPVAISSSLAFGAVNDIGRFGASAGATLGYYSGGSADRIQLAWVDRKGEHLENVGAPGHYAQIALSPDDTRIALEIAGESQADLWVMDVFRGVTRRLTNDPAVEINPVWSPDGQELVFGKVGKTGDIDIFKTGLDRGATAAPLFESAGHDYPKDWTRDGETLLFVRDEKLTAEFWLWTLPLAGESPPERVSRARVPRVSPDGRWLAFISDESGAVEVYVEPFRRPGERVRVSVDGGAQPRWRADGQELFYRKINGPMMAVEIREEAGRLEVGLPSELFATGMYGSLAGDHYGVSSDGQRFLVKVAPEDESGLQMHVVLNWESLLEEQ